MKAEILGPGFSMGGVRLGDSMPDVLQALGKPHATREKESHLFMEYDNLTVILLEESVFTLIAETPSCGQTVEGIAVGTTWRQVAELLDDVEYDEEEGLWVSPSRPGIWYEIVRPARSNEQPLDPPYVPELYAVADERSAHVRRIFVMR